MLVVVLPIVGTHSQFSADEGAAIAQAQLLSNGDGWTTTHPFPAADPSGEAFPIELSPHRGDQYAPFLKHPLYALLLAGADKIGGRTMMVVLSLVGTWCAAGLVALVTRRLDPRPGVAALALWLAGLASPLFFDGYILVAHALGAATAALAAWALVRLLDERGPRVVDGVVLTVAVFVSVLLRTEAVLLGVGLTVGGFAVARRRRSWSLAVVALVPVVAADVARRLESRWSSWIIGGAASETTPLGNASRGGGIGGRLKGFFITFLLPSYRFDAAAALTLAVFVLVVAAAVVVVRKPEDRNGPIVLLGAAAVAGVAELFVATNPVPGLLIVFPVIVFAAIVARRRSLGGDNRVMALAVAAGTYALLVLATQFSSGGSGEWGGRYFAVGLPLVVPLVALALTHLSQRTDAAAARTIGVLLGCAIVPIVVLAVLTLRSYHETTNRLVAVTAAAAAQTPPGDGGSPVVISNDGAAPRFAVDRLDDERWLTVKIDDIAPYADRLGDLGVTGFTMVARDEENFTRVPGYRVAAGPEKVGDWYVATMAAVPD